METLKNESVKEALKKCNPQRAIIALAEITDQFDTGIQNAQATADQALQDAAAAATVANKAKQEAAQATINVGEAFDNTRVTPNSSTVVVEFDRINGNEQNVPLPVVNTTNAGILNANDYKFFQEYDARIRAVEGVSKIYLVELPSDNPSSQQITLAYTSQWPDAPNPPLEGTVVVDPARNNLSYRWNTQSNTWYKISEVAIQQFTNTTLGTIKGSTQDGEVQANADGTGSVTGWDLVKTDTASSLQSLNALQSPTQIQIQGKNKAGSVVATAAVNAVNDTNAGVMTPAMLIRLNSVGPAIPLLILDSVDSLITSSGQDSDRASEYNKTFDHWIIEPITRFEDLIVMASGTRLQWGDYTSGEETYFHPTNYTLDNIESAINTWISNIKAKWYGKAKLNINMRLYCAAPSSNRTVVQYAAYTFDTPRADTPAVDPYVYTATLTIGLEGVEDIVLTKNPIIPANKTSLKFGGRARIVPLITSVSTAAP